MRLRKLIGVLISIIVAFILAFTCFFVIIYFRQNTDIFFEYPSPDISFRAPRNDIKGVFVSTYDNLDYPTRPQLSPEELKSQFDTLLDEIVDAGFDTLFFEISPAADALFNSKHYPLSFFIDGRNSVHMDFDPLVYMLERCYKNNITFIGVLNPLRVNTNRHYTDIDDAAIELNPLDYNEKSLAVRFPELIKTDSQGDYYDLTDERALNALTDVCEELAERYKIPGLLIDTREFGRAGDALSLSQNYTDTIKSRLSGLELPTYVGVIWPDSAVLPPQSADIVLPLIRTDVTGENRGFVEELTSIGENMKNEIVVPVYSLSMYRKSYTDKSEQNFKHYFAAKQGVRSFAYASLDEVLLDKDGLYRNALPAIGFTLPESLFDGLIILEEFEVINPPRTYSTTLDKFYITGTSNPNEPVYIDGEEIKRTSTNGGFGVLTELAVGENTFVFSQSGRDIEIKITRKKPVAEENTPITDIKSPYPTGQESVYVGRSFEIICTAPSGARITAVLDGKEIELIQQTSAEKGYPAKFSGSFAVGTNYDANSVTNIGNVYYTLSFNGNNKTYTSKGTVHVLGKNRSIYGIVISEPVGNVFEKPNTGSNLISTLKQGATDYVVGSAQGFFELRSGGYMSKDVAHIIDTKADDPNNPPPAVDNTVSGITYVPFPRGDGFLLKSTANPFSRGELTENGASITLYNTTFDDSIEFSTLDCTLVDTLTLSPQENATTLEFTCKPGAAFSGFDVQFTDEGVLVYLHRRPVSAGNPRKPLEGITVMLDPGHGGDDPGALGVAGTTGPTEKVLNMVNVKVLGAVLGSMGAEVLYTLDTDDRVLLEERCIQEVEKKPDFFISIHHNSVNYNVDANELLGIEVYYHTPHSITLAETLLFSISASVERIPRYTKQYGFRVARENVCPAVLVEMGYMPSPLDYETLSDSFIIYKQALGIADGLVMILANS